MTTKNNTLAYILRITIDPLSDRQRIVLKPSDGGSPHVFTDLDATFQFLQAMTNERTTKSGKG